MMSKSTEDKEVRCFIKNVFGIRPKNISLYKIAITPRQYQVNGVDYTDNNERFEYLGDAVIGAIVADYLLQKYVLETEGFLTEMRSKIVSRMSLGRLADKIGLSAFIKERCKDSKSEFSKSSNGDALEAIIGAIYLDRGFEATKKALINNILRSNFDLEEVAKTDWNFKGKLLTLTQRKHQKLSFEVVKAIGTGKDKRYHVAVLIDGSPMGNGIDRSIKAAEQLAAEQAYHALTEK